MGDKFLKNSLFILSCAVVSASCTLLRPLSLKPSAVQDTVQMDPTLFNGNYELRSADSTATTLGEALLYKTVTDTGNKTYLTLKFVDDRQITATLLLNGIVKKSRTLKGRFRNNSFEYHSRRLSLKIIFLVYRQLTNRLSISAGGDLVLDNNSGGIGFLLFIPIPLSGASIVKYGLKFKRLE